jgi:hypothetical protein
MADKAPKMRILSTDGEVETEVADPLEQSLVIGHWHALDRVSTGDTSTIGAYRGKTAADHELEADPRKITEWLKQGDVDFETIYASG